jgi:hypothetical protein
MGLAWNPVHYLFIYGADVELSSLSLYLWGWRGTQFTVSLSICWRGTKFTTSLSMGLAWNPVHYLFIYGAGVKSSSLSLYLWG